MTCVGTSSGQFRWELQLCPPKIHHRRQGRNCDKHHQYYFQVHSCLEVSARPPPNSPYNCPSLPSQKIEATGRFGSFTPPLGFRPRTQHRNVDIIDLVAQDSGSETRRGGTSNPSYAFSLRQSGSSRSKKSTFGFPAGRPYELRELQAVRKVSSSIKAERTSEERRNGRAPDYRRDNEQDNSEGLAGDTSMWDANAEGIRRGRFKNRSSIKSEGPPRDRFQKPQQELEYGDAEGRSRMTRNWPPRQQQEKLEFDDTERKTRDRFQEEEWDYDAEASKRNRTATSREPKGESSQWWQFNEDNDSYEYDGEKGEASASFKDLFSRVNLDVKDAFLFIRWGLPAAVLLVPWLVGNPMMLLLGLSFIPAANKLIVPIASQIFRMVMSGGSPSKARRKRKQSTPPSSSSSRRSQADRTSRFYGREAAAASTSSSSSEPEADLFSSVATTIFGDPNDEDLPRKPPGLGSRSPVIRTARKRLGGWEDLEEDRARARSERWPMERRSSRSEKKLVKREQNIFIRLILALFPFLRYWGGLM